MASQKESEKSRVCVCFRLSSADEWDLARCPFVERVRDEFAVAVAIVKTELRWCSIVDCSLDVREKFLFLLNRDATPKIT
jgi:hypothetical protein